MDKFYKVRKGFKYTGNESLNNLDYWYGPWNSIEDAKQEIGEREITPGFTIGIYDSPGHVIEYWWQKEENSE
jgi:hypothetical protein